MLSARIPHAFRISSSALSTAAEFSEFLGKFEKKNFSEKMVSEFIFELSEITEMIEIIDKLIKKNQNFSFRRPNKRASGTVGGSKANGTESRKSSELAETVSL